MGRKGSQEVGEVAAKRRGDGDGGCDVKEEVRTEEGDWEQEAKGKVRIHIGEVGRLAAFDVEVKEVIRAVQAVKKEGALQGVMRQWQRCSDRSRIVDAACRYMR